MSENKDEKEADCSTTSKNAIPNIESKLSTTSCSSEIEKDDDSKEVYTKGKVGSNDEVTVDLLSNLLLKQDFELGKKSGEKAIKKKKPIVDLTFEGLAKHWNKHGFKNIITMVGAGISTSAGIPDFRSPGSGLYNNLQKYDLPYPAAIFDLDYFRTNPTPFFSLAKELYPGNFQPTKSHYFVRMLHEKGVLLRHYTQNIDTLERVVGIPDEKLVEAHGSFYNNYCLQCRKKYGLDWMKTEVLAERLPRCVECQSVVKPDIVFFGENLPKEFFTLPVKDFRYCDLLIIMGTSLEVQPFASLIEYAGKECIRLLINREKVGHSSCFGEHALKFNHPSNTRDVLYLGDCDEAVLALSKALGWYEDLCDLMKREQPDLNKKNKEENLVSDSE